MSQVDLGLDSENRMAAHLKSGIEHWGQLRSFTVPLPVLLAMRTAGDRHRLAAGRLQWV